MPNYSTEDIRNIALIGPSGSGKTSLVESLLQNTGVIGAAGQVEKGDTVCDYTDEEKQHGCSLFNSLAHLEHQGKYINVIDTPGSADFIGQALTALPAVETVALVLNAASGVEPAAHRLMDRAEQQKLCRMIVVNKMDSENVDLEALVSTIQDTFGSICLPINLPSKDGSSLIDVFNKTEGEAKFSSVDQAHTAIIEQVVEVDEALMEQYLENGQVSLEALEKPFAAALREGHLVPICFVAARPHGNADHSVGIKELLEILVNLMPSPITGNPRPFQADGQTDPIFADYNSSKKAIAHVFNVRVDPFVGKLSTFRVHQGSITKDSQLYITDPVRGGSRKPIRVGHLFKLQGKEHIEISTATTGDIAAVAKIEEVYSDVILHEDPNDANLGLKSPPLPEPMQGLAITAKRRGDEQKIGDALNKLVTEDPTFKVTRDSITKETVIHGLGELHLRVVLEKLKNRYNVEVETKPPKIAYRETIQAKAEGHYRHKKQTGGAGQFGEVYLRVEPTSRGEGYEFSNDIFGGSIPNQFVPAAEKGINQALAGGGLAGYPIQDIKVSIYDGKHHPVDSKEVAFVTAGKRAFLDAYHKAQPVLLEPMVNIEVTIPNQYMGDIAGDLSGKRGRIQGTDMLAGDQALIKAIVPLAEVANYQSQLKSVTGGQGTFTMEFSHYDPVPSHVQQQIVASYKPRDEED